ncbi:MAG TPA: hypothetical protein VNP04_06930 [Alphaproteobacteria bacterium]|nr:hypothetical protein [Alphaproteobacteria bacterium]
MITGVVNANYEAIIRLPVLKNHPMASRIIRDTIAAGLLKPAGGSRKDAKYAPFWA